MWGPEAQKKGYMVNSIPAVGSVAWSNAGVFGHVAYVVAVNGSNVTVEEYNYLTRGAYDKRVVSASAFTGFIHFRDLSSPTAPPSTTPATTPTTPTTPSSPSGGGSTPAQTYAETTGGVAHTWTNYVNASGTEGPWSIRTRPFNRLRANWLSGRGWEHLVVHESPRVPGTAPITYPPMRSTTTARLRVA